MNRILFFIAIALSAPGAASARSGRHVALEEAVAMSLIANQQLRASSARVQQALANVVEARDRRLPDVSISGAYLRIAQPTVELKVPLGGSGSQSGSGDASRSVTVDQAMYGIANLSLPIYAGGRINYGIRSAEYLAEAARLDAANDRDGVVQNTIAAYVNLYKANAALKLVQENLGQAEARVQEFSRLEQNGLLARNDLLKAQLQQGNISLSLVNAEDNLALAQLTLNLMLGLPEETQLAVDSLMTYPTDAGTLTQWESTAIGGRADLAAQQSRIQAAEIGVRNARSGLLPSLALTGGYVAAHVPNLLTITNAVNAGIGVSYSPSTLWKGSNTVTQAKARVAEAQAGAGAITDAIRIQVAQAYQGFTLALKRIDVLATAVEQAGENYRIVNNKYQNNLSTTTDLLDADVARLQAQLNLSFAKADAATAYHKLLQVSHSEPLAAR